jgi:hypothetical protein
MEHHLGSLPLDVTVHLPPNDAIAPDDPGDAIIEWLRDEPRALPFAVFWQDLSALTKDERATRWRHKGIPGELRLEIGGDHAVLHEDDMFDLWQALRVQGYLTPHHIESVLQIPANSVVDLLVSLPYVTRVAVVSLTPKVGYDGRQTRTLLEGPEARGVRLVPSRIAERQRSLTPLAEQDGSEWIVSPTTSQLALFSTS